MATQLKFCLVGAAGAVVHKNPRSSRWDYRRIVAEVDAVYGPSSEHAAAISIELRKRVRKQGESLHALRDDIYEKVSIVYADRTEEEQDAISVEVFTNAMGDADLVRRLLEKHPRTLARAFEVAHRYEATKRAANSVIRLIRADERTTERRTRAAPVREYDDPNGEEDSSQATPSEVLRQKPPKSNFGPRRPKSGEHKKINWDEIRCHNCQGIGHMRRSCPSPQRPGKPNVTIAVPNSLESQSTPAVLCVKATGPEMCIHVLIDDMEVCALLDSGARRNVLPRHCYNNIHADVKLSLRELAPATSKSMENSTCPSRLALTP